MNLIDHVMQMKSKALRVS